MDYETGKLFEQQELRNEKYTVAIKKLATRMTAIETKLGLQLREEAEQEETAEMELPPPPKPKGRPKKPKVIEDDQDPPQEMPQLPKIDLGDLGL